MKFLWSIIIVFHLLLVGYCTTSCGGSVPAAPTTTTTTVPLVTPPSASIVNVPNSVTGTLMPDGTYALTPAGTNSGLGCAGSVAGSSLIDNAAGPIKTIDWTLGSTIVRPGERFTYQLCCVTREQAFSAGVGYNTTFRYSTVACPPQ